jgi:hypothetical protein
MNLKRLTALVALIYGLAAMGTALIAWYQEYSLLRHGEEVAAAALAQPLSGPGLTRADTALTELAHTLYWSAAYMTEANGHSGADQKIVAASTPTLRNTTWSALDDQFGASRQYWHGSLRQTYIGADGKRYALWAMMDKRDVAWPLLQQIALVTAAAAWLAITTWVSFDATGTWRLGWTALALFTGPVGLAIWLVRRPLLRAPGRLTCPGCGEDVPSDAGFCPKCGFAVQPVCPECGQPIAFDATYCKRCGAPVEEGSILL